MSITISEAAWQSRVTDYCDLLGLWWHHTPDSRRSNAGLPDLLIVGTGGFMFAELKSEKGKVRPEQHRVIERLIAAGGDARVWRPSDWPSVEHTLRLLAGRVST